MCFLISMPPVITVYVPGIVPDLTPFRARNQEAAKEPKAAGTAVAVAGCAAAAGNPLSERSQ